MASGASEKAPCGRRSWWPAMSVFAGTDGGSVVALEPGSGRRLWSLDAGGRVARGPAFADGMLYVGAEGGRFSAIDVAIEQCAGRWSSERAKSGRRPSAVAGCTSGPGSMTRARPTSWRWMSVTARSRGPSRPPAASRSTWAGLAMGRVYAASEDGSRVRARGQDRRCDLGVGCRRAPHDAPRHRRRRAVRERGASSGPRARRAVRPRAVGSAGWSATHRRRRSSAGECSWAPTSDAWSRSAAPASRPTDP